LQNVSQVPDDHHPRRVCGDARRPQGRVSVDSHIWGLSVGTDSYWLPEGPVMGGNQDRKGGALGVHSGHAPDQDH